MQSSPFLTFHTVSESFLSIPLKLRVKGLVSLKVSAALEQDLLPFAGESIPKGPGKEIRRKKIGSLLCHSLSFCYYKVRG